MQLVGTGFPGSRYSRAIAKVKDLVERSEAGDMKARSDLIHAAEIDFLVNMARDAIKHLMPLHGIKAADDARERVGRIAYEATEDLSALSMVVGFHAAAGEAPGAAAVTNKVQAADTNEGTGGL